MLELTGEPIAAAKRTLRAFAALQRETLHAENPDAAGHLRDHCLSTLGAAPRIVGGYAAIRSEIDPRLLMLALAAAGARLALPVVIGDGALEFRLWRQSAPLVTSRMGILEPHAEAEVVEPDLLLVPLLAFDRARHRLGYGAGYYDRTIKDLRRRKPVQAVGIAYAGQAVDRVPVDAWDERLDLILTDRGSI